VLGARFCCNDVSRLRVGARIEWMLYYERSSSQFDHLHSPTSRKVNSGRSTAQKNHNLLQYLQKVQLYPDENLFFSIKQFGYDIRYNIYATSST